MQVTLQATNHDRQHTFNLVVRDNEILLTTPDGAEIASLSVQTMETDVLVDEKYKTVPTDNFFICFRDVSKSGLKDAAMAWVKND